MLTLTNASFLMMMVCSLKSYSYSISIITKMLLIHVRFESVNETECKCTLVNRNYESWSSVAMVSAATHRAVCLSGLSANAYRLALLRIAERPGLRQQLQRAAAGWAFSRPPHTPYKCKQTLASNANTLTWVVTSILYTALHNYCTCTIHQLKKFVYLAFFTGFESIILYLVFAQSLVLHLSTLVFESVISDLEISR